MPFGQILQLPFVQIALPLMVVLIVNAWSQSKAIDQVSKRIEDLRLDMNSRFEAIDRRLERIEAKLDNHDSLLRLGIC